MVLRCANISAVYSAIHSYKAALINNKFINIITDKDVNGLEQPRKC